MDGHDPKCATFRALPARPAKFDEFKARYIEQLDSRPEAARFADDVRNLLRDTNVTLLYAARDPRVNHVVILRDWLLERLT